MDGTGGSDGMCGNELLGGGAGSLRAFLGSFCRLRGFKCRPQVNERNHTWTRPCFQQTATETLSGAG